MARIVLQVARMAREAREELPDMIWVVVVRISSALIHRRFSNAGRYLAYNLWGQGLPPRSPPKALGIPSCGSVVCHGDHSILRPG